MGDSTNSIRKELNHLQSAGYLDKVKVDNKVEYKANTKHPLFNVLQKVVLKHLGLEDVVDTVLERMGAVQQIILVGDYVNGNDSGKIEIFLSNGDVLVIQNKELVEINNIGIKNIKSIVFEKLNMIVTDDTGKIFIF